MSISNGRYEISQQIRDLFMKFTLSEKKQGAPIRIPERVTTKDPKEQQWDVMVLADGTIIIQNVMAKLFVGFHDDKVIATLKPCEWTLKEWGAGYAIGVPGTNLVIDDSSEEATLASLGDNPDLQWWGFYKV